MALLPRPDIVRNDRPFKRTSPVTAFPPNGYGLHDMIGNFWEWTADWWSQKHEAEEPKACCVPHNPRGGPEAASLDPRQPNIRISRKVLKGGSPLCAPSYCRRYPVDREGSTMKTVNGECRMSDEPRFALCSLRHFSQRVFPRLRELRPRPSSRVRRSQTSS